MALAEAKPCLPDADMIISQTLEEVMEYAKRIHYSQNSRNSWSKKNRGYKLICVGVCLPTGHRGKTANRANQANVALLTQALACRTQNDNCIDPRGSHGLCEADYQFAYCSPIVRLLFAYCSPTVRLLFAYRSPSYRLSYCSFSMG